MKSRLWRCLNVCSSLILSFDFLRSLFSSLSVWGSWIQSPKALWAKSSYSSNPMRRMITERRLACYYYPPTLQEPKYCTCWGKNRYYRWRQMVGFASNCSRTARPHAWFPKSDGYPHSGQSFSHITWIFIETLNSTFRLVIRMKINLLVPVPSWCLPFRKYFCFKLIWCFAWSSLFLVPSVKVWNCLFMLKRNFIAWYALWWKGAFINCMAVDCR